VDAAIRKNLGLDALATSLAPVAVVTE
jgi:hypothetical protein